MMQLLATSAELFFADDDDVQKCLRPKVVYELLGSLSTDDKSPDEKDLVRTMDLLEPNSPLDSIYDSDNSFSLISALRLCQILILEGGDSANAVKMLALFQALIFVELDQIRSETSLGHRKCDLDRLREIAEIMENITRQSDIFTRNCILYHGHNYHHGNLFQKNSTLKNDDSEYCATNSYGPGDDRNGVNKKITLAEFLSPREILLKSATEIFITMDEFTPRECPAEKSIFCPRTHDKLLEVAFSALKVPLDEEERKHANVRQRALDQIKPQYADQIRCSEPMIKYFQVLFPAVDWTPMEIMRPSLYTFFKRIDRILVRLVKSQNLRRKLDWRSITAIIEGLRKLLTKHPAFLMSSQMPHIIKSLMILLVDNYPTASRGIHEGLHQLASYRNSQESSPRELKAAVADFLSVVVTVRTEGVTLSGIVQPFMTRDLESQLVVFGLIPFMISSKSKRISLKTQSISKNDLTSLTDILINIGNARLREFESSFPMCPIDGTSFLLARIGIINVVHLL